MPQNSFEGDLYVNGAIYAATLTPSDSSVTDAKVSGSAAIAANKVQQAFRATYKPATEGTVAAAVTQTLHVANGAGTIKDVKFGAVTPAVGNATVTVDIYKNGASILTATYNLTSAQAARALVSGSIDPADATLAAGDVISVVLTVNAGTGTLPNGVFGFVDTYEALAA